MVLTEDSRFLQYAAFRPSSRLLVADEAAAPFFWLTLVAIIQERSILGPVERYALRSMSQGLSSPDQLAGFLGLERAVLDRALIDLWQADLVDLPPGSEGGRSVVLTARGREAAASASTLKTELTEIEVAFDRLTWEVSAVPRQRLLRPRDVRAGGWRQLDPRKGAQPTGKDVPLAAVREALETRGVLSANPEERSRELIAIRAVKNADSVYFPVDLLAFAPTGAVDRPLDAADVEVAIGLDGHISRGHSMAFAGTPQYARFAKEVAEPPPSLINEVPAEIAAGEVPADEVGALQISLADIEARLTQTERRESVEQAEPRTSTEELRRERDELRDRLASVEFRQLLTWELADVLRTARYQARKRLLIISPWITREVVDSDFVQSLGRLTSNGVQVHIGYGYPDAYEDKNDSRAIEDLNRIADRAAGKLILRKLGTTHEKILIFDDTLVTASFNWLSFKGDPKRPLRRESGTLVRNQAFVDQQYLAYQDVIEGRDDAAGGTPSASPSR